MGKAEKTMLRAQLKQARRSLPASERRKVDAAIAAQLAALPEYDEAQLLLTYLSFGSEIDTYGIVERAWEAGKAVAIPRCVPGLRDMRWYLIASFDGLVKSPFGVLEPAPDAPSPCDACTTSHALALVPGLTFDREGYRLGYGGGYYDRFLAAFLGRSVGLCRTASLVRSLHAVGACERHDLPVDMVLTQDGILRP